MDQFREKLVIVRNFHLCNTSNDCLNFGKGGPCGVLASIQAYILIELFFNRENSGQQITNDLLVNCLAKAISNILWKIGRKSSATVAQYAPKLRII